MPSLANALRHGPAARRSTELPGLLRLIAPGVGAILIVGANMRVLPAPAAFAVAVGLVAAVYGTVLFRFALATHRMSGPCRGSGFLAVGVIVNGLTAGILGLLSLGAVGFARTVAAAGLFAGVLANLGGLLFLPGAALTVRVRLRRAFDGLGVGICLLFTAWQLSVWPARNGGAVPVVAVLVGTAGVAIAVVVGLRSTGDRPTVRSCAAGAAASITGLATTAVAGGPGPAGAAGWLLIVGPVLVWAGARRVGTGTDRRQPEPAGTDVTLAGYPLLILPAAAAIVAGTYHFVTAHALDRTSVFLGIAGITVVAAREAFAAADLRRYARRLATRQAYFLSLSADANEVTVVLDDRLAVRWQSPASARHFGLSDQDVLGRPVAALVHPDEADDVLARLRDGDAERVPVRLRDGFGRWRETEWTIADHRADPDLRSTVVHIRDVGERTELERSLYQLRFTDALTGLANRSKLLRALADLRRRPAHTGAVLLINLDGFAGVNGARGHQIGDAVLVEVGRRLRSSAGEADLPARLGGDEFAIVTDRGGVYAYSLATRVLTALTEPYQLPGAATIRLTASIGVAELSEPQPGSVPEPDDPAAVEDMLRRAGIALRRARQLGHSQVEYYDEAMERALVRRAGIEQALPGLVDRGELDLVYQPVLDLPIGLPVGVEALLRWRHPELGTVAPSELIPVADELGIGPEIGEWVLYRACRQLSSWLRDGYHLWLAVNVSARQLAGQGFIDSVRSAVETHGVMPERLVIEITEHSLGSDLPQVAAQLAGLHELGVRVALDHFGTGPTALGYLRQLPIDILKIDRTMFTEPAGRSGLAAPIVEVVVGFGERLDVAVLAEGIDTDAHLDAVRAAGCRYGQGTKLAAPAPAEHVEAYLEASRSHRF
jgi:diguanylate cyclase (GGDEF)-like protein/PAS domain S-box-containing protein